MLFCFTMHFNVPHAHWSITTMGRKNGWQQLLYRCPSSWHGDRYSPGFHLVACGCHAAGHKLDDDLTSPAEYTALPYTVPHERSTTCPICHLHTLIIDNRAEHIILMQGAVPGGSPSHSGMEMSLTWTCTCICTCNNCVPATTCTDSFCNKTRR